MALVSVDLHLTAEPLAIVVERIQSDTCDFYSLRLGELMNRVAVYPFASLDDVQAFADRILDEVTRLRLPQQIAEVRACCGMTEHSMIQRHPFVQKAEA